MYARASLAAFASDYLDEVQALMACLLYAPRLDASPYRALVARERRADVERMLAKEYCRVSGLALESPLLSLVRCGTAALPVLIKAARVSPNWRDLGVDDALPVEIEVGRDCRHHSIFTCPVSREEATEANGPMILPCGHVLSRQSIGRLPRANNPRFKCPYCPMEQLPTECKPVRF
jgi:E3 ubiquitin-protein transferase RMND5